MIYAVAKNFPNREKRYLSFLNHTEGMIWRSKSYARKYPTVENAEAVAALHEKAFVVAMEH